MNTAGPFQKYQHTRRWLSLSAGDLTRYRAKFGHDPVSHQGPDGIATAIGEIFTDHGFPYETTLPANQQQILIDSLHALYSQDPRFKDLKLWPAARDWLRLKFPGSLNIPD